MSNESDLGLGVIWVILTVILTIIPLLGTIVWALWHWLL
tara:strand:- start:66044 stop:66160 length:117 start_codon:yes stop_codon:yes gene_type:complete